MGTDIGELSGRKAAIEAELESLVDDHDRIMALSAEFELVKEELDTKELRWLELLELE